MHLVLISSSGNQAYIFASNRLREAVGASELLAQVTTAALDPMLEAGSTVVQASSGTALVVVPDAAAARRLATAVTTKVLRDAPGLDIAACSVKMRGSQPTAPEIEDVFRAHRLHVAGRPGTAARHQRLPFVAACRSTDAPAASWHTDPPKVRRDKPAENPVPLSAAAIRKRSARPAADARMRGQAGHELVDIDEFFERLDWVGVIHADGNGLGSFITAAAEVLGGQSAADVLCRDSADTTAFQALSAQIQNAVVAALRDASAVLRRRVENQRRDSSDPRTKLLPLVPLIVGGDDLTALVDGAHALAFTAEYLAAFARHTADQPLVRHVLAHSEIDRPELTARAGVAIVKPHFPFSVAYDLAAELCENAKKGLVGNDGCAALDVHVLIDSTVTDLGAIRARYDRQREVRLIERPFLLPGSWDELLDRTASIRGLGRERADGAQLTRTQLHALRTELRTDPERARRRVRQLLERAHTEADRALLAALRDDGTGLPSGLLDLLELEPFTTPTPAAVPSEDDQ